MFPKMRLDAFLKLEFINIFEYYTLSTVYIRTKIMVKSRPLKFVSSFQLTDEKNLECKVKYIEGIGIYTQIKSACIHRLRCERIILPSLF